MAGGAGVRKEITTTEVVEKMQKSQNAGTKHFVITVVSILILVGAITAIAVMWGNTLEDTQQVLQGVTLQFREANANEMGLEIAKLMRPLYQITSAQALSMKIDTFDFTYATPASVAAFDQAMRYVYPSNQKEYHLDSTNAIGTNRTYRSYVGSSFLWGLDSSGNPSDPMITCSKATYVGMSADAQGIPYAASRQWVDATGTLNRAFAAYNPITESTTFITPLPPLDCPSLMYASVGSVQQPAFSNFMWYGPFDAGLGHGNQLYSSVPILNKAGGDPTQIVGYFASSISLAFGVSPLITEVLARGGDVSKNGEAMLYTSSGVVLGLSPWSGEPLTQPSAITDTNSTWRATKLYKALQIINAKFGTNCPTTQQFFSSDDLLIDLSPYLTENHGMPTLSEAWCQLTVLPRENIYAEIDKAKSNSVWVIVVAAIAGGIAMALLAVSLVLENMSKNILIEEQASAHREEVIAAAEAVDALIHPMCLIKATEFIAEGRLAKHEDLRSRGSLLYVENVEDLIELKKKSHVMFLSHQWLGNSFPDLDGYHYDAMCLAIEAVKVELAGSKEIYVWADYCSIAQSHRGLQALAVSSLPVYAASCDTFVVVAPTCTHHDSTKTCNTATYNKRGWCRAEMLSKVCGSGIAGMYYFKQTENEDNQLVAMSIADLDHLSLRIFEGNFTVAQDAETLVTPVLGLYSLILKQKDELHMRTIYQHIVEEKDRFFPKTIMYDNDPNTETQLFGPLVAMMEKHVADSAVKPTRQWFEANSELPTTLNKSSNKTTQGQLSKPDVALKYLNDEIQAENKLVVKVEPNSEEVDGIIPGIPTR